MTDHTEQQQPNPAQRAIAWLCRDTHKAKARQWRADVEKAFTEHPEMTGESYLQHLWFTVSMSARFAYVSFIIMTHGIFPFLFTKTASIEIEKIYAIMKSRIPKARREAIDKLDYFRGGDI